MAAFLRHRAATASAAVLMETALSSGAKKNSKHRGAAAAAPAADPDPKTSIERQLRAQLGALTGGLAPDDYARAWWDWYLSIARQPPKQAALAHSAYEKLLDSWQFAARAAGGEPLAPGGGRGSRHDLNGIPSGQPG